MKLLATFPGRHGDLLWALPSLRCLASAAGDPVTLAVSGKYGGVAELIRQQPYIADVRVLEAWQVEETAPMQPREAPRASISEDYDHIFDLGYEGWPRHPLPFETWNRTARAWASVPPRGRTFPALDLATPWIEAPAHISAWDVILGFTDEWFELKYGIAHLLLLNDFGFDTCPIYPSRSRWDIEGQAGRPCDWQEAAALIGRSKVFLGCNSALHVLACAMGKPVIMMEPAKDRHNDVFYPYGKGTQPGDRVFLVTGNDGLSTFDARHVADAVKAALERTR